MKNLMSISKLGSNVVKESNKKLYKLGYTDKEAAVIPMGESIIISDYRPNTAYLAIEVLYSLIENYKTIYKDEIISLNLKPIILISPINGLDDIDIHIFGEKTFQQVIKLLRIKNIDNWTFYQYNPITDEISKIDIVNNSIIETYNIYYYIENIAVPWMINMYRSYIIIHLNENAKNNITKHNLKLFLVSQIIKRKNIMKILFLSNTIRRIIDVENIFELSKDNTLTKHSENIFIIRDN